MFLYHQIQERISMYNNLSIKIPDKNLVKKVKMVFHYIVIIQLDLINSTNKNIY